MRVDQLASLGYLSHVPQERAAELRGVVKSARRRTLAGITGFGRRKGDPEGYFFDREGRELWRFSARPGAGDSLLWMEPTSDGNLLISGRGYLIKTDWSGRPHWQADERDYHHGFTQSPDGTIFAMTSRERTVALGGHELTITDDEIAVLSADGRILREISIFDLLGPAAIPQPMVQLLVESESADPTAVRERASELRIDYRRDVLHLNSVAVLPRDIGVAAAGDLLVCLRSLDLVLAVSLEPLAVVWRWEEGRELLERPHAPTPLANGNILIFDNGWGRGYSRLVELDPRRGEIVWQYVADPPESFYTRRGGIAQVLPDGHLLVTQSDAGRVFEITRAGEIVWDFWNPIFDADESSGPPKRRTIYRAWRWFEGDLRGSIDLPEPLRTGWLARRG